jgi:hypothetical protein
MEDSAARNTAEASAGRARPSCGAPYPYPAAESHVVSGLQISASRSWTPTMGRGADELPWFLRPQLAVSPSPRGLLIAAIRPVNSIGRD